MKKYLVLMFLLFLTSACTTEQNQTNGQESETNVSISGNNIVSIDGYLEVEVEADDIIRVPQITYYTPVGPWQIFKKEADDWEELDFYKSCMNLCDNSCEDYQYCAPGGPYPGCTRVKDSKPSLKWDLTILTDDKRLCGADIYSCKNPEKIEPGSYKVVFSYRDRCAADTSWTLEKDPIYTKEFFFEVVA